METTSELNNIQIIKHKKQLSHDSGTFLDWDEPPQSPNSKIEITENIYTQNNQLINNTLENIEKNNSELQETNKKLINNKKITDIYETNYLNKPKFVEKGFEINDITQNLNENLSNYGSNVSSGSKSNTLNNINNNQNFNIQNYQSIQICTNNILKKDEFEKLISDNKREFVTVVAIESKKQLEKNNNDKNFITVLNINGKNEKVNNTIPYKENNKIEIFNENFIRNNGENIRELENIDGINQNEETDNNIVLFKNKSETKEVLDTFENNKVTYTNFTGTNIELKENNEEVFEVIKNLEKNIENEKELIENSRSDIKNDFNMESKNDIDFKESNKNSKYIEEEILIYRLPGEKLGFGLKFNGGIDILGKINNLYIQSCAPNTPSSKTKTKWNNFKNGDEIIKINNNNVNNMTRLECIKMLKESIVVLKLYVRHIINENDNITIDKTDIEQNQNLHTENHKNIQNCSEKIIENYENEQKTNIQKCDEDQQLEIRNEILQENLKVNDFKQDNNCEDIQVNIKNNKSHENVSHIVTYEQNIQKTIEISTKNKEIRTQSVQKDKQLLEKQMIIENNNETKKEEEVQPPPVPPRKISRNKTKNKKLTEENLKEFSKNIENENEIIHIAQNKTFDNYENIKTLPKENKINELKTKSPKVYPRSIINNNIKNKNSQTKFEIESIINTEKIKENQNENLDGFYEIDLKLSDEDIDEIIESLNKSETEEENVDNLVVVNKTQSQRNDDKQTKIHENNIKNTKDNLIQNNRVDYNDNITGSCVENAQNDIMRSFENGESAGSHVDKNSVENIDAIQEAEIYTNLFTDNQNDIIDLLDSESDDTGSSYTTTIDRLSLYSSDRISLTSNSSFNDLKSINSYENIDFDNDNNIDVDLDRILEPLEIKNDKPKPLPRNDTKNKFKSGKKMPPPPPPPKISNTIDLPKETKPNSYQSKHDNLISNSEKNIKTSNEKILVRKSSQSIENTQQSSQHENEFIKTEEASSVANNSITNDFKDDFQMNNDINNIQITEKDMKKTQDLEENTKQKDEAIRNTLTKNGEISLKENMTCIEEPSKNIKQTMNKNSEINKNIENSKTPKNIVKDCNDIHKNEISKLEIKTKKTNNEESTEQFGKKLNKISITKNKNSNEKLITKPKIVQTKIKKNTENQKEKNITLEIIVDNKNINSDHLPRLIDFVPKDKLNKKININHEPTNNINTIIEQQKLVEYFTIQNNNIPKTKKTIHETNKNNSDNIKNNQKIDKNNNSIKNKIKLTKNLSNTEILKNKKYDNEVEIIDKGSEMMIDKNNFAKPEIDTQSNEKGSLEPKSPTDIKNISIIEEKLQEKSKIQKEYIENKPNIKETDASGKYLHAEQVQNMDNVNTNINNCVNKENTHTIITNSEPIIKIKQNIIEDSIKKNGNDITNSNEYNREVISETESEFINNVEGIKIEGQEEIHNKYLEHKFGEDIKNIEDIIDRKPDGIENDENYKNIAVNFDSGLVEKENDGLAEPMEG